MQPEGIKLYLDGVEVKTGSRQLTINEEYREFLGMQVQALDRRETHLEVSGTWTDLDSGHVTGTLFGVPFTAHVLSKNYRPGAFGILAGKSLSINYQMDVTLVVVFGVRNDTPQ